VSGAPSSNSRRPVSGVVGEGFNASYPFSALNNAWYWATPSNLHTAPQSQISYGTSVQTTLDYVGRNHGSATVGHVAGDTRGGWDLRTTNFLYVDGHVENKHVSQTIYPKTQWGDQFYTLDD
jgi:prepilin-type processing-associated H-X9-DG protein